MGFVSNKIKGLFFILVALAIIEMIVGFTGSKEKWEMLVTLTVQILQE